MVIPNFVRQALVGEPITVFGPGTQSRSFGYVGDVVRGMIALSTEPRAIGHVFNLGSNQEITIKELAELVKTMTASPSKIITIPYEKAYESGFEDMPRRVPDLTKAQELINFTPRTQLRDTLSLIIESQRQELSNNI
jgi:UDP-glucose 4-epimerase